MNANKAHWKGGSRAILLAGTLLLAVSGTFAQDLKWFSTGQPATLMLSGIDFNQTGGPLTFNHPSGIATDGTRLFVCDRFHNRVLIWKTLPTAWNSPPDLVIGQTDFTSNDPGTSKEKLNWPGNVSASVNGVVAIADTENDRVLIWKKCPAVSGTAADIQLQLPVLTPPGTRMRYGWPWGVWTDGTRLVASATHGGALLFWNTLPTRDNQPPDYTIALQQFGTLRNISTDGSTYMIVGDHNARLGGPQPSQSASYWWNSYPTAANTSFDFAVGEWIKGTRTPDGKLIAGGMMSLYQWKEVPKAAAAKPDVVLRPPYYRNGDGPDAVCAGGRTFINNYNGNNVLVYDGTSLAADSVPIFALGSRSPDANTLRDVHYIQNPVVATNGKQLLVTSDFDQSLSVWRDLPTTSGAAPDGQYSLRALNLSPWDNALHNNTFATAGKETVAIWNGLPLNGEPPAKVFRRNLGSARFQELKGIALDAKHMYVADRDGTVYAWNGIPESQSDNPGTTFRAPAKQLNHLHSDGEYLTVASHMPSAIFVYRVADIDGTASPKPWKTISATPEMRLNMPASAITFNGALAIANTNQSAVWLWRDISTAGELNTVTVLGQPGASNGQAAIGRNSLFWPATLAWDGKSLWVGEFKFSSRILRYDSTAP